MVLKSESPEIKEIGAVYRCERFPLYNSDAVVGCTSTHSCAFLQAGILVGLMTC